MDTTVPTFAGSRPAWLNNFLATAYRCLGDFNDVGLLVTMFRSGFVASQIECSLDSSCFKLLSPVCIV